MRCDASGSARGTLFDTADVAGVVAIDLLLAARERIFSALTMMTLSPSSTWGVKVGLCLPRSRIATIVASRPTTRPVASIFTHFFSISAGLAEKVFMTRTFRGWTANAALMCGADTPASGPQSTPSLINCVS
jgi:hypothetical protein